MARFIVGDSLRGAGTLAVFTYHCAYWTLAKTGYVPLQRGSMSRFGSVAGPLLETAALSIFMFFGLSGYLIGRPFVRACVIGSQRPAIRVFLRNRVLRLVPAMWVAFAVVLLVVGLRHASQSDILGTLTFTTNWETNPFSRWFGQAWTLKVEVVFYLLLPVVLLALAIAGRRMGRRGRIALVLAVVAACWAVSLLSIWLKGPQVISLTILGMGYAFAPGVALAAVEHVVAPRVAGHAGVARLGAWVGGLSIVLFLSIPFVGGAFPSPGAFQSPMLVYLVISAAVGCAVGGPLLRQWAVGDASPLLDNRILRWLGERSYSFYLYHLLLVVTLAPVAARIGGGYYRALGALILLAGTAGLIVAAISYRYVERPFLRRRSPARRPPPAQQSSARVP